MRKIIVWEFLSLDGVMESPDQWVNPYYSEDVAECIKQQNLASEVILLGRVTYEAFITFWPLQTHNEFGFSDKLNAMPKFVVSSTLQKAEWNNTTIIKKNAVEEIAWLKQTPGGDIGVTGSAALVQAMLQAELIDEFHLLVFPVVLGQGFHLFQEYQTLSLKLIETRAFKSGAVFLSYQTVKKNE